MRCIVDNCVHACAHCTGPQENGQHSWRAAQDHCEEEGGNLVEWNSTCYASIVLASCVCKYNDDAIAQLINFCPTTNTATNYHCQRFERIQHNHAVVFQTSQCSRRLFQVRRRSTRAAPPGGTLRFLYYADVRLILMVLGLF